ncbi:hypothetical protein LTR86_009578 [Recurvomyces mirabilis]|nr:hypothetical protein LTR86_009578 [Recurvomyces mirabilis]
MTRDDTYSPTPRRRRTTRDSHVAMRSSQLASTPASINTASSSTSSPTPPNSAITMPKSRLRARNAHRTPSRSAQARHTSSSDDLDLDEDDDEQHLSALSSNDSRLSMAPQSTSQPVSPRTAVVTAQAFELRNRKHWVVRRVLGRRDGMTWVRWAEVKMPAHMVRFDERTSFRAFVSLARKRYYITTCSKADIDEHGKASWLVRWEDEWLDDHLMDDLWVDVSTPEHEAHPQICQSAASPSLSHTLSPNAGVTGTPTDDTAGSDTELWNDIDEIFHSVPSSPTGLRKGLPSSATLLPQSSTPPTEDGENIRFGSPTTTPSISPALGDPPELIIPGDPNVDYGMVKLVRQAIETRTASKLFGQQGELRPTLAKWPEDKHPRRRTAMFAKNFAQRHKKFNLNDCRKAEAVIVQEIGEEVVPCDSCQDGKGALVGCVVMNHFDKGACTCCRANKTSHKCNFHQQCPNPRTPVPLDTSLPSEDIANDSKSPACVTHTAFDKDSHASDVDLSAAAESISLSASSTTSSNPRKRRFDAFTSGGLGSHSVAPLQNGVRFLPASSPSILGARTSSSPYPPIRPPVAGHLGLPTPTSDLVFRRRRSGHHDSAARAITSAARYPRSSPAAAKQERGNSAVPTRRPMSQDTPLTIALWIHTYENNFGLENQKLIANEFRHAWRSDFGQSGEPDLSKMPAYFCFGAGAQWFKDLAMPLAWSSRPNDKACAGPPVVLD